MTIVRDSLATRDAGGGGGRGEEGEEGGETVSDSGEVNEILTFSDEIF